MTKHYLIILALLSFSATAQEMSPETLDTVYDNLLQSIIAANSCSHPDESTKKAFTVTLTSVINRKVLVLMKRDPKLTIEELAKSETERHKVVMTKSEKYIKDHGCESEEVKALLKVYELHAKINLITQTTNSQKAVPDDFDSIAIETPNSYEFVKACAPTISESEFKKFVQMVGDKNTLSNRPNDKSRPYVVITKKRAYCIKKSPQKYPELPLAVFEDTISFDDMSKDEVKRFRTDLSRQLALTGFATALVINDKGNASQVFYMLITDTPTTLYYHENSLMKGSFVETNFSSIYRTTGRGGMTITQRGRPEETSKPFFWRLGG